MRSFSSDASWLPVLRRPITREAVKCPWLGLLSEWEFLLQTSVANLPHTIHDAVPVTEKLLLSRSTFEVLALFSPSGRSEMWKLSTPTHTASHSTDKHVSLIPLSWINQETRSYAATLVSEPSYPGNHTPWEDGPGSHTEQLILT